MAALIYECAELHTQRTRRELLYPWMLQRHTISWQGMKTIHGNMLQGGLQAMELKASGCIQVCKPTSQNHVQFLSTKRLNQAPPSHVNHGCPEVAATQ